MPITSEGQWVAPDQALVRGHYFPAPLKGRGGKDKWVASDVEKLVNTPIYQLCIARGVGMDIEQTAVEATGAAEAALASLRLSLDKFRGLIANDLTSIKAASTRVQNEAHQMSRAYHAAASVLTTPEFERAIANAERMATALQAISALSETKLSVAVFNGSESSRTPPGAPLNPP